MNGWWLVATAIWFAVGFLVGRIRRHHHRWTQWTGLIEIALPPFDRAWQTQRRCLACNQEEAQKIGRHYCLPYNDERECKHREQYVALFEGSPEWYEQIERDLGMRER